jgi:hypothetical protein
VMGIKRHISRRAGCVQSRRRGEGGGGSNVIAAAGTLGAGWVVQAAAAGDYREGEADAFRGVGADPDGRGNARRAATQKRVMASGTTKKGRQSETLTAVERMSTCTLVTVRCRRSAEDLFLRGPDQQKGDPGGPPQECRYLDFPRFCKKRHDEK